MRIINNYQYVISKDEFSEGNEESFIITIYDNSDKMIDRIRNIPGYKNTIDMLSELLIMNYYEE